MKRGFWVLLSLVLAVVVHLGYMLYEPSRNFEKTLQALTKGDKQQVFKILSPEQQSSLLPFATAHDVVGVCFYDLRKGAIRIEGQAPSRFWNFSIFTSRGRQVYDLNDTQVETNRFVVELKPASGLLSQILGGADGETPSFTDAGWQVEVSDKQGLAILWAPLHDALLRSSVEAVIRQSSCKPE
jgi:uncharacterized membrane protein